MSSLTHSQRQKINHFKAVTNIQSDDVARYALNKVNWDVSLCISLYFENADALLNDNNNARVQTETESDSPLIQNSPSVIGNYMSYIPGMRALGTLLTSIISYLKPYLSYFMNIFSVTSNASLSYSEILREFKQDNEIFASIMNNHIFCDIAFGELMKSAKCLFIYFNDSSLSSCKDFNKNILSNDLVIDYLRINMICWIGDDRNTSAKQLFRQITHGWNDRRKPFVCIAGIHPHSKKLVLVHRQYVGNYSSATQFIANVLDHGLQRWQNFKSQQIEREVLSRSNRDLREMQDREYMQALMQEKEKQEEEEEEEDEKEEEEKEPQEKEDQKRKLQKQIAKEKINALSAMLDKSQKEKLIRVALRLPSGQRVEHIFCEQNCVESLFDFALIHELKIDDAYIDEFELVCSDPKKIFTLNDKHLSLKSVGIKHSTILFVQEKD